MNPSPGAKQGGQGAPGTTLATALVNKQYICVEYVMIMINKSRQDYSQRITIKYEKIRDIRKIYNNISGYLLY